MKRKTQKQQILELLQQGKPVPRGALLNISFRFNSRIQELKFDGHAIQCLKTEDRWFYSLANKGETNDQDTQPVNSGQYDRDLGAALQG